MNNRGAVQFAGIGFFIIAVILGIGFLFGFSGIIKFLFTDKTPYIIGLIFILLLVFKKSKH